MYHRHGRRIRRHDPSAWGLTTLLLVALLGTSLVSEPEARATTDTGAQPQAMPAVYEPDQGMDFADRAYALGSAEDDAEGTPARQE